MKANMKIRTASPSRLKSLSACPRWTPDYDERDANMKAAAEEGTRLHNLCETVVMNYDPQDWDEQAQLQGGADGDLVVSALAPVRDVVMGNDLRPYKGTNNSVPVGHYRCEIQMESPLTGRQRLDFFARLSPQVAVICDFKFTRAEPDVRLQMEAYALTVFDRHPEIQDILLMAPAPRTFAENYSVTVNRCDDAPRMYGEIEGILTRMSDPFCPGAPGPQCCVCAGNGRCPWQAATLREIACDPEVAIVTRDQIVEPQTPEARGQRKKLTAWLKKFCEACDDQDKQWALENPEVGMPGWKVSFSLGRKTMDPARRLEAAKIAEAVLEIYGDDLLGCATLDPKALAAVVAMRDGVSEARAKEAVDAALDPVMKRGAMFPRMTPEVPRRKELSK